MKRTTPHPGRVPASDAALSGAPAGVRNSWRSVSGGVTALNHRLIAGTPSGVRWRIKKDYDKAIRDFDQVIRLDPKDAAFYNKACNYALLDRSGDAIENLRRCFELGFREIDHMAKDSDLDSIRDDPRYKQLVQKYAK
jgi:tetratricopeptide (TPR) repeat protein